MDNSKDKQDCRRKFIAGDIINKLRHSIRGQYTLTLLLAIVLTAVSIIGASLVMIHFHDASEAADLMNLHCRREGDAVDKDLISVKQSVRFIHSYAQGLEPDVDKLMTSRKARDNYLLPIQFLFKNMAGNTDGCVSYFFRYNPDGFSGEEGFHYSMKYEGETLSDGFSEMTLLPLNPEDSENESYSWFYTPISQGSGAWALPYYSDELRMDLITYSEPVYVSGRIVGVVGMSVDFDNLLLKIGKSRLYETGTVFLIDSEGNVRGVDGSSDEGEAALFSDLLVKFSSNKDVFSYVYEGIDKRMVYCTLKNTMKLALTADADEIYANEGRMIRLILLAILVIVSIIIVIGYRHAERLTKPLQALSQATAAVDAGSLAVDVPEKNRDDEIGILARTLQTTMDKVKEYSDYIEGLAYKDSLTGLGNKAAYDQRKEELEKAIEDRNAEFAVIMVDLNFLKKINDEYGHAIGNQYIINLCRKISAIFEDKDIYRVGGDEFVVILTGHFYRNRDEYIDILRESLMPAVSGNAGVQSAKAAYSGRSETCGAGHTDIGVDANADACAGAAGIQASPETEPWENVTAAVGSSVFIPGRDTTYREVFDRADNDMYEHKMAMKAIRD